MEATAPVLLLEQIHTEHGQQASVASQSENSSVRVPVDALANSLQLLRHLAQALPRLALHH